MAFLKFIAIVILIVYLFKLIGRILFPYLLKKMLSKMSNQSHDQFNQTQPTTEGEVTIKSDQPSKGSNRIDGGEYIDYEEIKD